MSLMDLIRTGGEYYLGKENIAGAQKLGRETQAGASLLADQARADTTFQPYTVTSGLANVATNAQGGFDLNLSPQQQALQSQLMGDAGQLAGNLGGQYNPLAGQIGGQAYGQAQNFLGQAGQYDPTVSAQRQAMGGMFNQQLGQNMGMSPEQRQNDIYSSIRATQLPGEERQRLALEERLLGQGRSGISTDAYGGTPEQFAMAKAQAEAGNQASFMARQQAQAEQQQGLQNLMSLQGADQGAAGFQQGLQQGNFNLGQGMFGLGNQASMLQGTLQGQDLQNMQAMMNAGYNPQQQALNMLQGANQSAGFADVGRRTGAELSSQMGLGGLESRMQAEDLANRLQLQQGEAILGGLFGQQATSQEQILNKILNPDGGLLTDTGGVIGDWLSDREWLPDWLK